MIRSQCLQLWARTILSARARARLVFALVQALRKQVRSLWNAREHRVLRAVIFLYQRMCVEKVCGGNCFASRACLSRVCSCACVLACALLLTLPQCPCLVVCCCRFRSLLFSHTQASFPRFCSGTGWGEAMGERDTSDQLSIVQVLAGVKRW